MTTASISASAIWATWASPDDTYAVVVPSSSFLARHDEVESGDATLMWSTIDSSSKNVLVTVSVSATFWSGTPKYEYSAPRSGGDSARG